MHAAWLLIGLKISAVQGPLRNLTSRPSIACLRDMNAANAELMRAIGLEHEAYGQLFLVFTTQVGSLPTSPLIVPPRWFLAWLLAWRQVIVESPSFPCAYGPCGQLLMPLPPLHDIGNCVLS